MLALCASAALSPPATALDPPQEEEQVLGAAADLLPENAGAERIWVEPGTRLYARPDVRSQAVATIDSAIELEVLERREHWVRVRFDAWKGWIATRPDPADAAPGRRRSERVARRLELARELLGAAPGRFRELGAFELLTDVGEPRVLRYLSRIATHLPQAYRDRYGLDPPSGEGEAVVLFAREEDYRAYEAEVRPETDRGALGHADQGLAVLYVGRQGPEDVAAVLVHELTHVLNRRALAQSLPPWLDEGMANDLAFCRIDGARRLELGSLGGRNVRIEHHSYHPGGWLDVEQAIHLSGPAASHSLLRARWRSGDALSIEQLADLAGNEFFDPEERQARYDSSAFFVRYLLDGEDGELAAAFRAFLASLAAGEPAEAAALASRLGRTWPQLERGFAAWLVKDPG